MSEWEVVSVNKKKPKNESEWEIANEETPNYESKGLGGIASDAFNKAIQTAIGIPSAIMNFPHEAYGAGKQLLTDPKRVLQNVAGGFGELGHGILSAPGNIRDYLQKKDIVSENAPSFRLPESVLPKDYDYAQALGAKGNKPGDEILRGLPTGVALTPLGEIVPPILGKIPGVTNTSIANRLSRHKEQAIKEATENYNNLFSDVEKAGVHRVDVPNIHSVDIIKHSQPKYHEALKNYMNYPSFENAHWAQSDLGFIIRHLQKVDEKSGLSSTQHKTLKNALAAQNRIKQAMFDDKRLENKPHLKDTYNQLNADYAKNVVPYKQLEELSDYENKKMTANNAIKSLLGNDEFMLGLGKKYAPQLLANKGLRGSVAKALGLGALGGLGFEESRKFIK